MSTPREECDLRTEVRRELGIEYDPFRDGHLEMVTGAPDPQEALARAMWLLEQALPLAKQLADALVQLELELDSTDTVEGEFQLGMLAALRIVRGVP